MSPCNEMHIACCVMSSDFLISYIEVLSPNIDLTQNFRRQISACIPRIGNYVLHNENNQGAIHTDHIVSNFLPP